MRWAVHLFEDKVYVHFVYAFAYCTHFALSHHCVLYAVYYCINYFSLVATRCHWAPLSKSSDMPQTQGRQQKEANLYPHTIYRYIIAIVWHRIQGRPRGGGQGAVAPPWKLAGIYFLVHNIFVSWKLWILQYFLEHETICVVLQLLYFRFRS